MDDDNERSIEIEVLSSIFLELKPDLESTFPSFKLDLEVILAEPITIQTRNGDNDDNSSSLTILPTLTLDVTLPDGYPFKTPPIVRLKTAVPDWLSAEKLESLQNLATQLWQEYDHSQIIYTYTDALLAQAQESCFGLLATPSKSRIVSVPSPVFLGLLDQQAQRRALHFAQQTFSCPVCLEPKKGRDCYEMRRCGHVFCKECLCAFYDNCITEGDVFRVLCMQDGCKIACDDGNGGTIYISPMIAPAELLQIPVDAKLVQRYVDMHRKKLLDADKDTTYCPRQWCQAPALSKKHPKLGAISDIKDMQSITPLQRPVPPATEANPAEVVDGEPIALALAAATTTTITQRHHSILKDEEDEQIRLAVCENCSYAFCKLCRGGWHTSYNRCWAIAVSAQEAKTEEVASLEYLRLFAAECPGCGNAVQRSEGCNHMTCYSCRTHFCYICGIWLEPWNPYRHYKEEGTPCYYRLFEQEDETGVLPGGLAGARLLEWQAQKAVKS